MAKLKLKDAYAQIPENKRDLFRGLLENAEFMESELAKLRVTIEKNGVVDTYQNGPNQYGTKKSSEVEVYNLLMKHYLAAVKQINDLIPADSDKADEFLAFVGAR